MSRRQRRKAEKAKRHATSASHPSAPSTGVVRATKVERLAYTRTQAAEALGVTRTTFDRRVLPLIETIDIPWGPRLVPVDELERFAREWRRPARGRARAAPVGRPRVVSDDLVLRIRAEHANGKSLRQIARGLNASGTPTAHGGRQWWPSTVRVVLERAARASAVSSADGSPTYTDRAMAHARGPELGPAARPVAVPEDLDDPALPKARGRIELPLHIRWSGPPLTYDLDERADRARVYEQVLREGTEDDVRYYVDADQLRYLGDELVLPPAVRQAWTDWFRRRRVA